MLRPSYYEDEERREFEPQLRFGMGGGGWTPAVKKIIIITCICYGIQILLSGTRFEKQFYSMFWLTPKAVVSGSLWQLVTYAFLHAQLPQIFHILFNMLPLWMLGREVERAIGWQQFFALYLLSGIAGGVCICILNYNTIPVLGASGCVLGVIMAFGTLFPRKRLTLLLFFVFPVQISARTMVIGLTLWQLLNIASYGGGNSGIAYLAHLGGLSFGYAFIKTRPRWERFLTATKPSMPYEPDDEDVTLDDEKEMDRLLDKVKSEGLHKLTWKEKRFLDGISQRLRDR